MGASGITEAQAYFCAGGSLCGLRNHAAGRLVFVRTADLWLVQYALLWRVVMADERLDHGRIRPGVSLNPSGRPKGAVSGRAKALAFVDACILKAEVVF